MMGSGVRVPASAWSAGKSVHIDVFCVRHLSRYQITANDGIRWCVQHDVPVITKSTHRERLEENAHVFDLVLSEDDVAALDSLDETGGTDGALERTWW
jgi:diketogulonate reductase-like aldo/keto reductase